MDTNTTSSSVRVILSDDSGLADMLNPDHVHYKAPVTVDGTQFECISSAFFANLVLPGFGMQFYRIDGQAAQVLYHRLKLSNRHVPKVDANLILTKVVTAKCSNPYFKEVLVSTQSKTLVYKQNDSWTTVGANYVEVLTNLREKLILGIDLKTTPKSAESPKYTITTTMPNGSSSRSVLSKSAATPYYNCAAEGCLNPRDPNFRHCSRQCAMAHCSHCYTKPKKHSIHTQQQFLCDDCYHQLYPQGVTKIMPKQQQ